VALANTTAYFNTAIITIVKIFKDTKYVGLVGRVSLSNSFSDFYFYLKAISLNFAIFFTCKSTFGVRMPCGCAAHSQGRRVGFRGWQV
jgi:hypothetical protein